MLTLSRRVNEVICIGDHTLVKVLAVNGGKVKLGILAPESERVDRREVRERIKREKNDETNGPLPDPPPIPEPPKPPRLFRCRYRHGGEFFGLYWEHRKDALKRKHEIRSHDGSQKTWLNESAFNRDYEIIHWYDGETA